jgi:hypothetical protein
MIGWEHKQPCSGARMEHTEQQWPHTMKLLETLIRLQSVMPDMLGMDNVLL